jgi:hypothetical protein
MLERGSSLERRSRLASLVSKRPPTFEQRTWLCRESLTRDTKVFSYPLPVDSHGTPELGLTVDDVVLRCSPTRALQLPSAVLPSC